ncbi:MAG: hypothetical protein IT198_07755 [Acidimicrobiia bacterium]|nr:hypothetical protein [Acidimicrobiia bacterium]
MLRRILPTVVLIALVAAACGGSRVENYELDSYDLKAGEFEYKVELAIKGNIELGALEAIIGSSAEEASNLDVTLTADAKLEVKKEGANNVLTLELTDFKGKLPFGADYPNDKETYEMTVSPQGEIVRSSGDGLLAVIPGVPSTFGFNCPPLPGEATKSGATWTSEVAPPFSDEEGEKWESSNRWKDTDAADQQVAEITANVDQDFESALELTEVVELLGLDVPALTGVKATAKGHLTLATACALSIPDQALVESGGTNKINVAVSVDAGTGIGAEVAKLVSGITLDLSIEGKMTPTG